MTKQTTKPGQVTPQRAGHILGSAYLLIDAPDGRLLMSGDLGNRESGLQLDFTPPPAAAVAPRPSRLPAARASASARWQRTAG